MIKAEVKKTETKEIIKHTIKVSKAVECKNGAILVDLDINGVDVNGAFYKEGVKDGKEWSLIQFPQYKGTNGKYYNYCWCPLSKGDLANIERQIKELLKQEVLIMALRKMYSFRMKMEHLDGLKELQKRNHLHYSTMIGLALDEYLIQEKDRLDAMENLTKKKKRVTIKE